MNAMDLDLGATWFLRASKTPALKFESRRDAYFHAGVAAYRRCCNEGQRSRITAGHAQRVHADGASLHNELIELGNQLVGHSTPLYDMAPVGARCLSKQDGLHALIDGWGSALKISVSKEDLKRFALLCYALNKDYVRPEIDRMQQLLNHEISRMTPEQVFTQPIWLVAWGDKVFNLMDPDRKYPGAEELSNVREFFLGRAGTKLSTDRH
jgi:hypothetical protein